SDHSGGDPGVLVRLCRYQSRHRPALHPARPEDPLLSAIVEQAAPDAAPIGERKRNVWKELARNPSVLAGGAVLLVIIVIGLLAPLLGTIDPAAINPGGRNKNPGTEISMRLDDGTKIERTAWMGT